MISFPSCSCLYLNWLASINSRIYSCMRKYGRPSPILIDRYLKLSGRNHDWQSHPNARVSLASLKPAPPQTTAWHRFIPMIPVQSLSCSWPQASHLDHEGCYFVPKLILRNWFFREALWVPLIKFKRTWEPFQENSGPCMLCIIIGGILKMDDKLALVDSSQRPMQWNKCQCLI